MATKEGTTNELAVQFNVGGSEIKLTPKIVQEYIVGTASQITMPEFKFFVELCKVRQLNPFLKEAYCIKYGNEPAQIVVSKDVFVKRAILHPQYDGKESGIVVQDKDGNLIERPGCMKLDDETLVGGWARVYRKDKKYPEYMSVSFNEVAGRKKDGSLNFNWSKKGATMVEKVAKVRALREAFTEELGGMYEEVEFDGSMPESEPDKVMTPEISGEPVGINEV